MSDHFMQPAVLVFAGMMVSFALALLYAVVDDRLRGR